MKPQAQRRAFLDHAHGDRFGQQYLATLCQLLHTRGNLQIQSRKVGLLSRFVFLNNQASNVQTDANLQLAHRRRDGVLFQSLLYLGRASHRVQRLLKRCKNTSCHRLQYLSPPAVQTRPHYLIVPLLDALESLAPAPSPLQRCRVPDLCEHHGDLASLQQEPRSFRVEPDSDAQFCQRIFLRCLIIEHPRQSPEP